MGGVGGEGKRASCERGEVGEVRERVAGARQHARAAAVFFFLHTA